MAASLALAAALTWRLSLPETVIAEHQLTDPLPLPELPGDPNDGPMTVTVAYPVAAENVEAFLDRSTALRQVRRRTGAIHWHLQRDVDDPDLFTELFVVGSWEEHERQHARLEQRDQDLFDQIDSLLEPGQSRTAHHAVGVRPRSGRVT